MDGGMFCGLVTLFRAMTIILLISVPLGLWKLIEIIIWICNHIRFA